MRHRVLATFGVVGAIFLLLGCIAEAPVVRDVALEETTTRGAKYTIDMRTEDAKTTYDKLGGDNIQSDSGFMYTPTDLNGDGKADFVFSTPSNMANSKPGTIDIVHGNDRIAFRSQFNKTDPYDLSITDCKNISYLSYDMDCDFDGDGYNDIVARGDKILKILEGDHRTYYTTPFINIIFGGNNSSLIGDRELASMDNIIIIDNRTNFTNAEGFDWCTCGDLNGDGYDDLVFKFNHYNETGELTDIRIVYGGPRDKLPNRIVIEQNDTKSIIVSSSIFNSLYTNNHYIQLQCTDFNGDGIDDLIVYSPINWYYGYDTIQGRIDIIYGTPDFSQVNTTLYSRSDLSFYNPQGRIYYDFLSEGDFNADGKMDLICDVNSKGSEETLLLFGSDLHGYLLNISTLDVLRMEPDIITNNPYAFQDLEVFGPDTKETSFSGTFGDFNGDGIDDILFRVHKYPVLVGEKYLIYPVYDYLPALFVVLGSKECGNGTISIPGSADYRIFVKKDLFEAMITYNGDINGDGMDELILYGYDYREKDLDGNPMFSIYIIYPSAFINNKFKAERDDSADTILIANILLCVIPTVVLTVPFVILFIYKRKKKKEKQNKKKSEKKSKKKKEL